MFPRHILLFPPFFDRTSHHFFAAIIARKPRKHLLSQRYMDSVFSPASGIMIPKILGGRTRRPPRIAAHVSPIYTTPLYNIYVRSPKIARLRRRFFRARLASPGALERLQRAPSRGRRCFGIYEFANYQTIAGIAQLPARKETRFLPRGADAHADAVVAAHIPQAKHSLVSRSKRAIA